MSHVAEEISKVRGYISASSESVPSAKAQLESPVQRAGRESERVTVTQENNAPLTHQPFKKSLEHLLKTNEPNHLSQQMSHRQPIARKTSPEMHSRNVSAKTEKKLQNSLLRAQERAKACSYQTFLFGESFHVQVGSVSIAKNSLGNHKLMAPVTKVFFTEQGKYGEEKIVPVRLNSTTPYMICLEEANGKSWNTITDREPQILQALIALIPNVPTNARILRALRSEISLLAPQLKKAEPISRRVSSSVQKTNLTQKSPSAESKKVSNHESISSLLTEIRPEDLGTFSEKNDHSQISVSSIAPTEPAISKILTEKPQSTTTTSKSSSLAQRVVSFFRRTTQNQWRREDKKVA